MPTEVRGSEVAPARPRVWRITDRATFQDLRRSGRRARRGPLSVTWLPAASGGPADPPRLAVAVPKAAGGAVLRNRVRRRLRAAMRTVVATGDVPAGAYLIGATAAVAEMPWSELCSALQQTIGEAAR